MQDNWKRIYCHHGYEITSDGRLRNRITGKILKPYLREGYHFIKITPYGTPKRKGFGIHKLVAFAFIGEPSNKSMVVNHKDGNRLNNNVDNLEWCSVRDNILHARRVTKNGCVLSKIKIMEIFKKSPTASKDEFYRMLIDALA